MQENKIEFTITEADIEEFKDLLKGREEYIIWSGTTPQGETIEVEFTAE